MKIETLMDLLGTMAKTHPGCDVELESDDYGLTYSASGVYTSQMGEEISVVIK